MNVLPTRPRIGITWNMLQRKHFTCVSWNVFPLQLKTKYLAPLLVAYDDQLREKEEIVNNYQVDVPSTHPSTQPHAYLATKPSTHRTTHPSTQLHLSTYETHTHHTPVHTTTPIHPPIHPSIYSSNHTSVYSSTHTATQL